LSLTLTHLYTELCPIDYVFRRQDSEWQMQSTPA
jgi:hypothetical protein